MGCITWALIGMAGYSFVPVMMKLATRTGRFSPFFVLAVATTIVATSSVTIATCQGGMRALKNFSGREAGYALATGIALTIAVASLFRALSMGPSSVVVPIYGMFIVGGSMLGLLILHEPFNLRKLAGIALAIASIYLIAGSKG